MTLGDMITKIARRIIRSDLNDDIIDSINNAIEYASVNGNFAADIIEGSVALDSSVHSQSIVISTTFTRFRKIKYLRPEGYNRYIKWHDPAMVFDDDFNECTDVWYRAGDNLVIKLSELQDTMLYAYYQFPAVLSADADTSWMLTYMPSVIFDLACAEMWESIGNAEEGTRFRDRGMNRLLGHVRDHKESVEHG